MKWRVIPLQKNNAFMNMAVDEAISEAKTPTIRFYKWKPSAVSIGYFQGLLDEVDVETCAREEVNVVRRRTGGGAVFHDSKGEITYSVIAPEELFPKDITGSYRLICGWIVEALKTIGIESEFKPINDVIAHGKKISGNAQTRRGNSLLQHGTILYGLDVKKMFTFLKVDKEKISDKMIKDVEQRVTCIKNLTNAGEKEAYEALVDAFTKGKMWGWGKISEWEFKRAEELVRERYTTKAWNYMR